MYVSLLIYGVIVRWGAISALQGTTSRSTQCDRWCVHVSASRGAIPQITSQLSMQSSPHSLASRIRSRTSIRIKAFRLPGFKADSDEETDTDSDDYESDDTQTVKTVETAPTCLTCYQRANTIRVSPTRCNSLSRTAWRKQHIFARLSVRL